MVKKIKCPFCSSNDFKYLRKLNSNIIEREYTHYLCNYCDLEFFTPLEFVNIYEDETCKAYGSHHKGKKDYLEWTKELIRTLKSLNLDYPNLDIFDVGAGDCINFKALNEIFGVSSNNYTALELDSKSCKVCKKRGVKNLHNFKFNKEEIKKVNKKFDLIISTEVIEHQIDLKDFLDGIFSLLKKDGYVVFTTPNRERIFVNKREYLGGDVPPNHFLRFNKNFFQKNLKKNLVFVRSFPYGKLKNFSEGLSNLVLKNSRYWPLFLPFSIASRIISQFKGDGLVVVLKKQK